MLLFEMRISLWDAVWSLHLLTSAVLLPRTATLLFAIAVPGRDLLHFPALPGKVSLPLMLQKETQREAHQPLAMKTKALMSKMHAAPRQLSSKVLSIVQGAVLLSDPV